MKELKIIKHDNYDRVENICLGTLILVIYAIWMFQIRLSPEVVQDSNAVNRCFIEASMMSFMSIAYMTYNRKVFASNLIVAIAYFCYYFCTFDEVSGDFALCFTLASVVAYIRIIKTTKYKSYNWKLKTDFWSRLEAWIDEVNDNEVEPIKLNLINTLIIYGFALMIIVRSMTIIRVTEVNTVYDQLGLFIEACISVLPLVICLLAVINSYEAQLTRAIYHALMIYSYVSGYLNNGNDMAYMYLAFLNMVLMGLCIYSIYYKAVKDDVENMSFDFETIKIKDRRKGTDGKDS